MATLADKEKRGATNAVMVLTDGVPDRVEGLDTVVAEYAFAQTLVSAFGFGYSLNTTLLADIASSFGGTFTFIPDASFVGTAFVNNTASILSTVAQDCTLTFEAFAGAEIADVVGSYPEVNKLAKTMLTSKKGAGGGPQAQWMTSKLPAAPPLSPEGYRAALLRLPSKARMTSSNAMRELMPGMWASLSWEVRYNAVLAVDASHEAAKVTIAQFIKQITPTSTSTSTSASTKSKTEVEPPTPSTTLSQSKTIRIGPCLLGQSRSACIILDTSRHTPATLALPLLKATFTGVLTESVRYEASLDDAAALGAVGNPAEAQVQQFRLEAAETLADLAAPSPPWTDAAVVNSHCSNVNAMASKIAKSGVAADPRIVALLADLKGQVTEAVSKSEWYNKWGKHYLTSLSRSHTLQQCTNFKDPGLQVYGGAIFSSTRDAGDDIFVDLPPPTPTGSSYSGYGGGGGGGGSASSAPIDMSRYYNSSGGCFKPGCVVTLANGATKLVEEVRKGDVVATGGSSSAAAAFVTCVIKTRCPGGVTPLVTLGGGAGPTLTEYHPVRTATGSWAFPRDLASTTLQTAEHVYTYLLEKGATSMIIDGVECCTLGHGLDEAVVQHAYLGSHAAVTADLERVPGWDSGVVLLDPESFVRANGATGAVCAIKRFESTPLPGAAHHPPAAVVASVRAPLPTRRQST